MGGTKLGGKRAAATNKAKYGNDFYARIGAEGGKKGRTGGFFANRELARTAGAIGGRKSKRGKWTAEERANRATRTTRVAPVARLPRVKATTEIAPSTNIKPWWRFW